MAALPVGIYTAPTVVRTPFTTATPLEDSTPVIAVDPANPNHRVVFWQEHNTTTTAAQTVRIVGAYTTNGLSGTPGWVSIVVANNEIDPSSAANAARAFAYAINPSVAFDNTGGKFHLLYTEQGTDGTDGAVVLRNYDFSAATPVLSGQRQIVTAWYNGVDAISNATMTVDNTLASYTDSLSSAPVANNTSGQIYVAWTVSTTRPTAISATGYHSDAIQVKMSSDGGNTFSAAEYVSDGGALPAVNYVRPTLTVSQGGGTGAVPAGQVGIGFTDTTSLRPNTGTKYDQILFDRFSNVTTAGGIATPGNIAATNTQDFNIPITVPATATALSDIELTLAIATTDQSKLAVSLIAPDGTTVNLFQNGDLSGTNLGQINGRSVGTIFDQEAARVLNENGVAAERIGRFSPSAGDLSNFYTLAASTLGGNWVLHVDNANTGIASLTIANLGLTFDGGIAGTVGGTDIPVAITSVLNSRTDTFAKTSAAAPVTGIGTGLVLASDNTIGLSGAYAPHQGRIYASFVDRSVATRNQAPNTDIALVYSDDGGVTWYDAQTNPLIATPSTLSGIGLDSSLLKRVNDDTNLDGSGGSPSQIISTSLRGRAQFEPSIAVDPVTGLLALSWLDARIDNTGRKTATYVAASNDGGLTFAKQSNVNATHGIFDVNTQSFVNSTIIPDDQSVNGNDLFGYGVKQGLAVYGGVVTPAWASNQSGGFNQNEQTTIRVGRLSFPAGPRVVSATSGVVSLAGDVVNLPLSTGPAFTAIDVKFDRPINTSTFTSNLVSVIYRQPGESGVSPGTSVAIGSIAATSSTNDEFLITLAAPQVAVGTYSYYILPSVTDTISVNDSGVGNSMDQNADGIAGQAPSGFAPGDTFTAPSALAGSSQYTGSFFTPLYDSLTYPVIVPGPKVIATAPGQGTPSANNPNLFVNGAATGITIQFDRDMDASTLTGSAVLKITGPFGDVTGPFTVTPVDARTYFIQFPEQIIAGVKYTGQALSGQYSVQLSENIADLNHNKMDVNGDGGLDVLRGTNPIATSTSSYSSSVSTAVSTVANATTDVPLVVGDLFNLGSVTARLSMTTNDTTKYKGELISPTGTSSNIFDSVGASGTKKNFTNTIFDDTATVSIKNAAAPFFGSFTTQTPNALAAFAGQPANGTWILRITALGGAPAATVTGFGLNFTKTISSTGLGTSSDRTSIPFRIYNLSPSSPLASTTWTAVGPAPSTDHLLNANSGAVSTMAVDSADPSGNTVYAAGVTGGIFRTTNFLTSDPLGPTWVALTDYGISNSLPISSIALFNRNNDPLQTIVFAATGNNNASDVNNGTGIAGIGFLRSMNAGQTWDVLDSADNRAVVNGVATTTVSGISATTRNHVLVGTVSYKVVADPTLSPSGEVVVYAALSGTNGGIWRSVDTGLTWQLMRAGNATDVILDETSATKNAQGKAVGNVDIIYGAFQGDGIYQSPNRGVVWNKLTGGAGRPLLRNYDTTPITAVATGNSSLDITGQGRVILAHPAPTGNATTDLLYQGWVYALVSSADRGLYGLFLTKDFGQNWTKVRIPADLNNGAYSPSTDIADGDYPVFGTQTLQSGDHDIALSIDPSNPNIVYVGGANGNTANSLIRVNATLLGDTAAFYVRTPGDDTPTTVTTLNNPPTNANYSPITFPAINLLRDPTNAFNGSSTIAVTNTSRIDNDGSGVVWTYFDSILNSTTNVHQILTIKDPATGLTRLLIANDQRIMSAIDVNGKTLPSGATATTDGYLATLSGQPVLNTDRVGNLQLGVMFSGAVQPSLTTTVAASFFLGGQLGDGLTNSDINPLSTGSVNWNGGTERYTYEVATDPTGSGTIYSYTASRNTDTDFFQVNGVGKTFGLLQAGDNPLTGQGQWPYWRTPIKFVVNPINGDQIIISSTAGRIFATSNQGNVWNVIGNPAALDSTQSRAMAFGAPPVSGPTGALNDLIYVGTEGGNVFVTFNGGGNNGNNWINISNGLDGTPIRSIVTNPNRGSYELYVVTSGGNVYWMSDSSAANPTWVNITGNLATITADGFSNSQYNQARLSTSYLGTLTSAAADWRYIIPDASNPNSPFPILYVGGNGGVFRSFDRGTTWSLFPSLANDQSVVDGGLLPNTVVSDLDLSLGTINPTNGLPDYSTGQNLLTASLYGRGMYAIRVAPLVIPSTLGFQAGDDTGSSAIDKITMVSQPTVVGVSQASALGNVVYITLVDLSDPLNPRIIGGYDPADPATAIPANQTDIFGKFSIQVAAGSFTTDGDYMIGAYGTDPSGLVSQPVVIAYQLDTTAPSGAVVSGLTTATDTGISSTDGITNNTRPTFTGTSDPGATLQVFIDGVLSGTATASNAGVWNYTPPQVLPAGTYSITASQTDLAGNASAVGTPFVLQIVVATIAQPTPPTLDPASDTGAADRITSNVTPTFTGTTTPDLIVRLFANGVPVGVATAGSDGRWAILLLTPLVDGDYAFTVTNEDTAGNVSLASAATLVTIDTLAPAAPGTPALIAADDTGVSSVDNLTKLTTPRLTGTALPGSTVQILRNGVVIGSGTAGGTGIYVATVTTALSDGSHTLTVRCIDGAGNVSAESAGLTIRVDTTAPTSVASPITSSKSQTITSILASYLDASAFASAVINWGDGTTSAGTAGGSPVKISGQHTYLHAQVFNYSVTVTDAAGNVTTVSSTATITGGPVIATGGFTLITSEGTASSSQRVAIFTDPTGADPVAAYSATINWGDGTSSAGTISQIPNSLQFAVNGSHSYSDEGQYSLSITISVAGQNAVATSSTAQVGPGAVTLSPVSFNAVENTAFNGVVATFLDPATNGSPVGDFTGVIDWGDGTTTTIQTIQQDVSNPRLYRVIGSKTYGTTPGTYQVKVSVFNKSSGSATTTSTATVSNGPPVPTLVGQSVVFAGLPAKFTPTAQDSTADQPLGFTYTVNWGDGSALVTIPAAAGNGTASPLFKTYSTPGTYTVTFTATDVHGASAQTTQSVRVVPDVPTLASATVNGGSPSNVVARVTTIQFTLTHGGSLPNITLSDLGLTRDRLVNFDLSAASLTFDAATGVGALTLSSVNLVRGVYDLNINVPNGPTTTVRFMVLPGDTNGDGQVNKTDVTAVQKAIGKAYSATFDINNDGVVNKADLTLIKSLSGSPLLLKPVKVAYKPGKKISKINLKAIAAGLASNVSGSSVVQDIVITNSDKAKSLTLNQLLLSGDPLQYAFEVNGSSSTSSVTLAPGASVTLRVYFRPMNVGTFPATISFASTLGGGGGKIGSISIFGKGTENK